MPPYFFWAVMFFGVTGGAMLLAGVAVLLYTSGRVGTRKAIALTLGVCVLIGVCCSGLVAAAVWVTACEPPQTPVSQADILGTWDEVPGGARGASITFSDAPGRGGTFEMTGITADWFGKRGATVYSARGTWEMHGTHEVYLLWQSFDPPGPDPNVYSNWFCGAHPPYELRVSTLEWDPDATSEVTFRKR